MHAPAPAASPIRPLAALACRVVPRLGSRHDAGDVAREAFGLTSDVAYLAGMLSTGASIAKAVCARCPVQRPCLTYALATRQEFGIWGGRDEDERRLLHRQWRQSRIAASVEASQP
jgi:hypothetical protein